MQLNTRRVTMALKKQKNNNDYYSKLITKDREKRKKLAKLTYLGYEIETLLRSLQKEVMQDE